MTYLELVRRLASEVGTSNFIQTLQGAEGEVLRLANWINESWMELQMVRPNWRWRISEFEVVVPGGQPTVDTSGYSDFYRVVETSVYGRTPNTSVWTPLPYVGYSEWQDLVRARSPVPGVPNMFTERPDLVVELSPIPADDFHVRGLYVRRPQPLVNDFDVPYMPEEFHPAIVYKAMTLYAGYEAAPEIYQSGVQGFNRMYRLMVNADVGPVELPGALA